MILRVLSTLFFFLTCTSGNPRRYSYVPTAQFQDEIFRISDLGMHPHHDFEPSARQLTARALSNNAELTKDYWINNGKDFVAKQVTKSVNTKKAKNVIIFVGDGMSHSSVAAARVVLGGEEVKLSFENFPHVASSKTYCLNAQVADSACSITAMLHGIKTNNGLLGMNGATTRSNCNDQTITSKHTQSIGRWFQDQNRSTGLVTTTSITHATPAGVYANSANRDWEGNADVTSSACNHLLIDDIAEQLVHGAVGSKLKVALGGGSRNFVNTTTVEHGSNGRRTDGKNLINEWLASGSGRNFVRNREGLMAVNGSQTSQLFGLFNDYHLPYNLETLENKEEHIYPTLTEMTEKAIDVLSKDDNGYFLLVEGGRIDHGHHYTWARLAIDETVEFHKAIQSTVDKVDLDETLIVVTADHSHTLTLGGYSSRGHDIFGTAGNADDGMPYFTLSYANGPGYANHRVNNTRVNPATLDASPIHFEFPTTVPLAQETHAGEDVGVWAIGPNSHLLSGVIEQNYIAHVMAYASCVGDGLTSCDN